MRYHHVPATNPPPIRCQCAANPTRPIRRMTAPRRYASVPVGLLSADAPVLAMDVLMQRRLLQSGHLSWLSSSPRPDLGGLPANDTGGGDELANPELVVPGMYRTVCVELSLTGLAVNTVREPKHA